jgi:hypothetical protein
MSDEAGLLRASIVTVTTKLSARDIRVGLEIGCLTVIGRAANRGKRAVWECRCSCGRTRQVFAANLVRRPANRCHCSRQLDAESRAVGQIYHGIVKRTTNPNCKNYHRYGGRGIKMCDRWLASFADFISDMGPRPSRKHSIDRFPNKDGDYEPGNCRWATQTEQQRNRENNRLIEFCGQTLTLAGWGEKVGILPVTIQRRIDIHGWSIEKALTTKPLTSSECARIGVARRRASV